MKNMLEGINGKIDIAEVNINEFENRNRNNPKWATGEKKESEIINRASLSYETTSK